MKFNFVAILALLSATPLLAAERPSEYPGDYGYQVDSKTVSNFTVQRIVQTMSSALELNISYNGPLLGSTTDPLTLQAIVHYQNGDNRQIRVHLTRQGATVGSARITDGCLVGMLGGCQTMAPVAMKDFLYWSHYATNLNSLNIDFAVDAGNNRWDSGPNGDNYQFHFPAH